MQRCSNILCSVEAKQGELSAPTASAAANGAIVAARMHTVGPVARANATWSVHHHPLHHHRHHHHHHIHRRHHQHLVLQQKHFEGFAQGDDSEICKREIAAFLGQTSHETTGGWATAPDGPYSWGYCFKEERGATADYCVPSVECPCAPGKKYYGRGPIQISYNYNYCQAGEYLGLDLLSEP
ncbi:chitinase 9 [Cinnamomum micranthum f. kanehirae]|uniref:Chitinase 9 n=1 Tax=Cinnamomum micranthum f. kanehirae TaxID=337451 RepID=A0A3S3N1P7_9MAGN|nr:chitinase 9 [Cinnamomum micranthum f. kanehirae]